jgi:hypothetical protein
MMQESEVKRNYRAFKAYQEKLRNIKLNGEIFIPGEDVIEIDGELEKVSMIIKDLEILKDRQSWNE